MNASFCAESQAHVKMHVRNSMQNCYISWHSELICINAMNFYCLVEQQFCLTSFCSVVSKTIFEKKREKKYCVSRRINSIQNKRQLMHSFVMQNKLHSMIHAIVTEFLANCLGLCRAFCA